MKGSITHSLVKALQRVPGFELLTQESLLEIIGASVNLVWPAGRNVFTKGSSGEALYVVLSGKVRIFDVVDDSEITIAETGPGDYFGEMSLLLETMHTKNVQAVEASELLVLMKEPFRQLLDQNPELAARFRSTVESRRTETEQKYQTDAVA